MSGRRAVVLAGAILVVAAGCGKSERRVRRDRDGGAVTADERVPGGALVPVEEVEPNDREAEATAAPPGSLVRGSLDGETDVDVYRVTVPEAGQLRAMLGGIEEVDLILELRDAAGAVLARSDRGPARTSEGIPNYGVHAGDYFLVVREFVKPRKKPAAKKRPAKTAVDAAPAGRLGPSPTYELAIELTSPPRGRATDLQELEPNDDPGTAVEVLLADTVQGWIGWSGDVDLWKLALEGVAEQYAVDIEVSGVEGLALAVEVLDAGGVRLLGRKGGKGSAVVVRSLAPALGPAAPPWHFVKISADRSHPEMPYELRFTARLREPDEEAEPNDEPTRANPLASEGSGSGVVHAAWSAGDVDRFRIEPQAEPALLDLAIEAPTGVLLDLEIGIGDRPPLTAAAAPGQPPRLSGIAVPARAAALITVRGRVAGKGDDGGEPQLYRLVWSLTPAAGDPMPPEEGGDEPWR
jgi:hypothetical protein